MDALTMVREDHRKLERLLERLEQRDGDEAEEDGGLLDQLQGAVRRHVEQEESFLYPTFRERARRAQVDLAPLDQGIEQHRLIERLAGELTGLGPGDGAFAAKLRGLTEQLRRHLDREDSTLLTAVEDLIDDDTLFELGRRMEQRRRVVAARRALADTIPLGTSRSRRAAATVGGVVAPVAALFAVLARRRRPPSPGRTSRRRRIGRR
jgi:hemerythrin-like domain-containing protein